MRSHGLPSFPNPVGRGAPKVTAQELGVRQFPAPGGHQAACQHLLPATGGSLTASSLQQWLILAGVCPQTLVQQRDERRAGTRPVHALSRGAELARPLPRRRGAPTFNILVPVGIRRRASTALNEFGRLMQASSVLLSLGVRP